VTGKELAKTLEQLTENQKDMLVVFVDRTNMDTSYTVDEVRIYDDLGFIFLNSIDPDDPRNHQFNIFEDQEAVD